MPRACCQPKGLARISPSCRREYALEEEHSELSNVERRVRALETVMTQKGYIDPAALDVLIDTYQTKVGPRNGARVVARARARTPSPRTGVNQYRESAGPRWGKHTSRR